MDDLSEKPQDGLTGEVSFGPDDPQVQARSAYDVSPIIDQNLYKTATAALERNRDRPFSSAHEFVQHQLNKDEQQLPQYDREAVKAWQEGAKGLGHLAAYNIPVVGEGLALYDMANAVHDIASPEFREAVNKGDYLTSGLDVANLALSALGVPWKAAKGAAQSVGKAILGAPGKAAAAGAAAAAGMTPEDAEASFFSKRAFMSPAIQKAMREAEAATLIHGRNPHEVFKEHGWTPDPSGHMVSELSDEGARIIPEGLEKFRAGNTNLSLGDVLSHPDLFDLYPSSYSTKLTPYLPRTNPEKERGYFNATGDQIGSNIRLSERDLLENLLHEHQHRIQRVEGMSPGQNSEDFQRAHQSIMIPLEEKLRSMQGAITLRSLMKQNPELSDPVSAIMFAKQHNIDIGPQPLPYVKKDIESLFDDMRDTQNKIVTARQTAPDPFQEYLRSLGEYTARLPGERLGMSAAERRNAYPFDPNYPVIVRAPARDLMHQVANPKWEAERDRAVELARELQKNPIPHKDKGGAVAKLLGKLMPPGSGYAPRKGFQTLVDLPGIGKAESRPIPGIEEIARRFAGPEHDADVTALNPEFARRVAGEYDVMRHDPTDAAVKRAYEALADETMQQYRAAKDLGLDIRFLKPGEADPYAASPALGYEDLVNRGRMFVFPTESGFGSSGEAPASNVLLKGAGRIGNKDDAVINDAFRVVHDLFGHHGPGNPSFRAPGEERAYQLHSRMFSPEARPALTSETRGQNSWVNFGPEAERNRTASGADTIYADQKTGIMPAWTMAKPPEEGADVGQYIRSLRGYAAGGAIPRADDEAFFRRLALWTYSVAPLFSGRQALAERRRGYGAGGKALSDIIERAIRSAKVITSEGTPTVRNMARETPLYPDVYKNPRLLAEEAEGRVAKEDPMLKRLWGVNREDIYDIAGHRPGNVEPVLAPPPAKTRGINYASEAVMVPENAERLRNILEAGYEKPGLRKGMMPWYYMDPVYNRLEQMFGPEEAVNRYNLLNTSVSMMSPASNVKTEINRGLGAYHMALQGRFNDFVRGGGKPSAAPLDVMPQYMRDRMVGHLAHSTSQAGPLSKYIQTGKVEMESPKVPLYIQSSGVPETGFQTKLPVPDAHYTRVVGMPDVRRTADPEVSMKMNEYRPVGNWFREEVAKPMEMEAVPAQALMWGTGSGATGVDTAIGAPKLELLSQHIGDVAKHYRISPETARDLLLQGTLYKDGGSVIDHALDVVSNIPHSGKRDAA